MGIKDSTGLLDRFGLPHFAQAPGLPPAAAGLAGGGGSSSSGARGAPLARPPPPPPRFSQG